jgi:hypothetical protein
MNAKTNVIRLVKKDARNLARNPHMSGGFAWADDYARAMGLEVARIDLGGGCYSLRAPKLAEEVRAAGMKRSVALAKRYNAFCFYRKETRHAWQVIETRCYGSATDVVERSQLTGETRQRPVIYAID